MLNINRIIMAGNLTKDPELKNFGDKKLKATLTLAVNKTYKMKNGDYKKDTSYFRAIAWNTLAQNCIKYLKKGSPILIEGALENLAYEDDKGTKKYITQINCDQVTFLSNSTKRNQSSSSDSELLI